MSRHYLDHASTSPLRHEARAALLAALDEQLGDPSRMHSEGITARSLIEEARDQVARLAGARNREVVFTSSATEAIAAAVLGGADRGSHQVLSAVEHSAVREQAARAGRVTVVGVDRLGRVDPEALLDAVEPDTGMVHLQWANHEVGTVQAVREVVQRCRERKVLVHVDAAAAFGHIPVDFGWLGADLTSVSSHKLGGPTGVGALLVRRGVRIPPLLLGGDQERGRRAGQENTAAIAGFGAAAAALCEAGRLEAEAAAARALTERVLAGVAEMPGVEPYGDPEDRLPHIVCLGVQGLEPQPVLIGLDRRGVAVHSGSSCSSEALEPSPILEAMGVDAQRSLRVSVGWSSTAEDVESLLEALRAVLEQLRSLAG